MNIEFVMWFAGVVATLYALKFVIVLFRTLFSKKTMLRAIDGVGNSANRMAERMTNSFQEKMEERRERKQKQKEQNKPVVVIR